MKLDHHKKTLTRSAFFTGGFGAWNTGLNSHTVAYNVGSRYGGSQTKTMSEDRTTSRL
jgi:hypothetical protein